MGDVRVTEQSATIIMSDASVLIDYAKADPRILRLICEHIGEIYVPNLVFDEVDQIDEREAKRLGLKIIEPMLSQIEEAGVRGGPLSRSDKLTFIMARDLECICWTSDANLKRRCDAEKIRAIWGLEIMLMLVQKGHLTESIATNTARTIKKNGAHLNDAVVMKFEKKVKALSRRK